MKSKRVIESLADYLLERTVAASADGDELLAERFVQTTATLLEGSQVSTSTEGRKI